MKARTNLQQVLAELAWLELPGRLVHFSVHTHLAGDVQSGMGLEVGRTVPTFCSPKSIRY